MSNILQKAFYLPRQQDPLCIAQLPSRAMPKRSHCGASLRQTAAAKASAALVADWQPASLVSFYAAGAVLRANVSSVAAKPAPLLRPSQNALGRAATTKQQQA